MHYAACLVHDGRGPGAGRAGTRCPQLGLDVARRRRPPVVGRSAARKRRERRLPPRPRPAAAGRTAARPHAPSHGARAMAAIPGRPPLPPGPWACPAGHHGGRRLPTPGRSVRRGVFSVAQLPGAGCRETRYHPQRADEEIRGWPPRAPGPGRRGLPTFGLSARERRTRVQGLRSAAPPAQRDQQMLARMHLRPDSARGRQGSGRSVRTQGSVRPGCRRTPIVIAAWPTSADPATDAPHHEREGHSHGAR